jgi:hypothetical protein
MANLTTFAMAEDRAKAQMAAGTWVVAYACRGESAALYSVRFIRPMSPSAPGNGGWVELTDNTTD